MACFLNAKISESFKDWLLYTTFKSHESTLSNSTKTWYKNTCKFD